MKKNQLFKAELFAISLSLVSLFAVPFIVFGEVERSQSRAEVKDTATGIKTNAVNAVRQNIKANAVETRNTIEEKKTEIDAKRDEQRKIQID